MSVSDCFSSLCLRHILVSVRCVLCSDLFFALSGSPSSPLRSSFMALVLVNDHAKDSSRFPKYDGGIKSWREGSRIVMKSFLHSKKLLEVVLHGPISRKHSTQQYSGRVGTNLPQEHFDQQYSGRAGTNLSRFAVVLLVKTLNSELCPRNTSTSAGRACSSPSSSRRPHQQRRPRQDDSPNTHRGKSFSKTYQPCSRGATEPRSLARSAPPQ